MEAGEAGRLGLIKGAAASGDRARCGWIQQGCIPHTGSQQAGRLCLLGVPGTLPSVGAQHLIFLLQASELPPPSMTSWSQAGVAVQVYPEPHCPI